jgi:hypothetical protein
MKKARSDVPAGFQGESMESSFWGMALAPFMLFLFLLIAWPIKRLVQLKMKDGPLKRFLLIRWGD